MAATRLALMAGSDRERRIRLRFVAGRGVWVSFEIDVLDFFGDGGVGGVACRLHSPEIPRISRKTLRGQHYSLPH